jgi:hypothetical protein
MHTLTLQLLKDEYMIKMQNENQTFEWDNAFFSASGSSGNNI